MNFKKLVAPILSIAIIVSMLAGCTVSENAASKNSSVTPSSVEANDGPKIATPSWKTDTSDITIKWFFGYDWYGKKFAPETNTFDKWVKDETGCSIEIQTGDVDKLNVLISTDSLPDVTSYDANSTQRTMLENNNKLYPLNELRDKYAPDFNVPKSMIEWYTAPDGNWYSYCNFYYGDDNTTENNGYYETHNANFARQDILDQIGMKLDDLRTKEGLLKALRIVKEKNISYKGQKVLPYMALFTDKVDEQMAEQFGASKETKEGKYISIYRAPEYLEAILFFNQLYREGLMTDESFTAKKDQVEQKVAAGQLFATTRWTNVSNARGTLFSTDNNAAMLYCGMAKGDNHDKVVVAGKDNAGWAASMINKKATKPERIIQLFAFMATKEFTLNNEFGVDGYTVENDHVVRKPDYLKLQTDSPAEYSAKYFGDIAWVIDYTYVQGMFPQEDTVFGRDTLARVNDDKIEIFDDKCFSAIAPEAGSEEAAILSRVDEYKKQALGRIVTAATPEESEKLYNEAIVEMDKLGLPKLEIYQNSRFQSNKKQLGLEFAHPFNQK